MYTVSLSDRAKADYAYFRESGNLQILRKIVALIGELREHPFTGTGKPEPLKYDLTGCWSRRINSEHRLVYKVDGKTVEVFVLAMRYHYSEK